MAKGPSRKSGAPRKARAARPRKKALVTVAPEGEAEAAPVAEALRRLQQELAQLANKGRYTRVRFKFRGKPILPDLPLAAVMAAQGLTVYWGGILRALLFSVASGAVLDVELINEADKRIDEGREALLSGDVDGALKRFREALAMDAGSARAQLNVGVALKLRGDREGAVAALEEALQRDPDGPHGLEAQRILTGLRGGPLGPEDRSA